MEYWGFFIITEWTKNTLHKNIKAFSPGSGTGPWLLGLPLLTSASIPCSVIHRAVCERCREQSDLQQRGRAASSSSGQRSCRATPLWIARKGLPDLSRSCCSPGHPFRWSVESSNFPNLLNSRPKFKALHLESQERTAFVLDGLSATAVQAHQAERTGASHQGTRSPQHGGKPFRWRGHFSCCCRKGWKYLNISSLS